MTMRRILIFALTAVLLCASATSQTKHYKRSVTTQVASKKSKSKKTQRTTKKAASKPKVNYDPIVQAAPYTPNVLTFYANGVSFQMVEVQGGTFRMGATSEQGRDLESDPEDNEKPVHSVTLDSYYIGKTEVTQALWKAVMGNNPSYFKGDKRPVEGVSWYDCQTFFKKLNRLTGKNFRLPTEAEWEFACRGGNNSKGYEYSGSNDLFRVTWNKENSGDQTHPVGTKAPNELGLYDMGGNVWEWCSDWYGSYTSNPQTNPTGPTSGSSRVCRGGSWRDFAWCCRSSLREVNIPSDGIVNIGLRLAL